MIEGRPEIIISGAFASWRWTHGYAEDVAEAVVLAATDPGAAGRTYNVGEPETPTWTERLADLAAAAEWHGRIVTQPSAGEQQFPPDPRQDLVMDSRRIREELGYREVTPRQEGYRRTVAWERG
jgi:nucleoside-diphosphate-sugar epimerase